MDSAASPRGGAAERGGVLMTGEVVNTKGCRGTRPPEARRQWSEAELA
jgi:hypothetical protein